MMSPDHNASRKTCHGRTSKEDSILLGTFSSETMGG